MLRTFLEVNRMRHFGRAAEALHLTQAAVSARIKQLEIQLGVKLFERAKRGLRLTPEGHRLRPHAELLLAEWRKARQEVTAGGAARQLSVGGSPRLWDVMLRNWLIRLRRADPEMALITHSQAPDLLLRRLFDGVIDLAFMLDPPQTDSLHALPVAKVRLVLVSNQADISAEEAVGKNFLMVDWGLSHALELRRAFPDMPEPFTRLANTRTAITFLSQLGGAAYMPHPLVTGGIRRGELHRVQGAPEFVRAAYAVYPIRSEREALIDEVLQLYPKIARARQRAAQQNSDSRKKTTVKAETPSPAPEN